MTCRGCGPSPDPEQDREHNDWCPEAMRAENDPAEETCAECGRVDLDAFMCWRVGHLPKDTP